MSFQTQDDNLKAGWWFEVYTIDFSPHFDVGFLFLVGHCRACSSASASRRLHTHNLLTHNLLTHNLSSHTTCPHTTYSHTQLTHTQLVHTQLTHPRLGTWPHRPSLCVAGVTLGDTDVHSAWHAWHLWHWAGSGGALGPHLAPLSPQLFVRQAWRLATSTFTLRGSCGTYLATLCHTQLFHTELCHTHTQLFHT